METKQDHWVGSCHVAAEVSEARKWDADTNEAVADVVMLVSSSEEMHKQIEKLLAPHQLRLVWLEQVEPLMQKFRREGMIHKLATLAQKTTPRSPLAFGPFRPLYLKNEVGTRLNDEAPTEKEPVSYKEVNWDTLFEIGSAPLWGLVDGVNCRDISGQLSQSETQSVCLYTTTDPATKAMAPWLVRLEQDSDIINWLKNLPQDSHWGILLQSHATIKQLRAHLRKYTMIWIPTNNQAPVYFRFYDPRVALDMTQALEPWKIARFFSPVESLFAPLSPLMILPQNLELSKAHSFDSKVQDCQERLIQIKFDKEQHDTQSAEKSFSVGGIEFDHFEAIQKQKSRHKIARDFLEFYPDDAPDKILQAVIQAEKLGGSLQMTSVKQITTLAKCILEFGPNFPRNHEEAEKILNNRHMEAWRKCNLLEDWIPQGLIHRDSLEERNSESETIGAWIEKNKGSLK